jgi:hypothetical protein
MRAVRTYGMRIAALVCLIVGCGSPQTTTSRGPIGNTNAVKQPSREAFVEDVVQALSAGDADRLIALVDTRGMIERALQCDAGARPSLDEEALRRRARASAAKTKGTQLAFVEVEKSARKRRHGMSFNARLVTKGEAIGDCTARTELLFHDIKAVVRMMRNGKQRETTLRLQLVRADGKWFLVEIPRGPQDGSALEKMEEFKTKMCTCKEHDTRCAQGVTDEMTKWAQEMAKEAGDFESDDIAEDDMKRMVDLTHEMGECSMRAMTPDLSNP